jgi:hypothetical protein
MLAARRAMSMTLASTPPPVVLKMRPRCLADFQIDQFASVRFHTFERAFFVGAHQARVTGHIGGDNGGKTTSGGHFCQSAKEALAKISTLGLAPYPL